MVNKIGVSWTVLATQLTLKAKICISENHDSGNCIMRGLGVDFFHDLLAFSNSAQMCTNRDTSLKFIPGLLYNDCDFEISASTTMQK